MGVRVWRNGSQEEKPSGCNAWIAVVAIVRRSEDALAQSVRCGGIEWATKRKPRKPILPKNNPRVSVSIPKGKDGKNARYIAVEPPQTKERAGSNPGLFYIPRRALHF